MEKSKSKTQQALEILEKNPGMRAMVVCRMLDITPATISRALARKRGDKQSPQRFSKTRHALSMLSKSPGMTQTEAALLAGIDQSTVSHAYRNRAKNAGCLCQTCGQKVPYLVSALAY